MTDEDKMIQKLKQYRDIIKAVITIAHNAGIDVKATMGNNYSNGDLVYDKKDNDRLVEAIDKYLDHRKVK